MAASIHACVTDIMSPVAVNHLQVRVDENEVGVTLLDAVRLLQTVPRPDVVLEPLHRLLYNVAQG